MRREENLSSDHQQKRVSTDIAASQTSNIPMTVIMYIVTMIARKYVSVADMSVSQVFGVC